MKRFKKKWIWKHRDLIFGLSGGFLIALGNTLFWLIVRRSPSILLIGLSICFMVFGIIFLMIASWNNN